jgi:D-amino-acid oxidase
MSTVTRRQAIKDGLLAAGTLLVTGCARAASAPINPVPVRRQLTRVEVARNRVIRMVAGLRPYRPSGFVVQTVKYGAKNVIHNYGHGGAGISLSWGSAMLAADLADQTGDKTAAVIGAGVMGLCTARVLQDRGYQVTIYTKQLPPDTTSNIAGGQWGPFSVHDAAAVTPAYLQQYERAARLAHRQFQNLIGDRFGVRWIDNYVLRDTPAPPQTAPNPIADLLPAGRDLEPAEHSFGARYVRVHTTMLIEPFRFLSTLQMDYLLRGGRIVVREFHDLPDLLSLTEPLIVNCTGLGSGALFGDREITPVKGQLVFLLPQPEVDYIAIQGEFYMFPRSDGILLGGSRERGVWSTQNTADVTDRILTGHQRMFAGMS